MFMFILPFYFAIGLSHMQIGKHQNIQWIELKNLWINDLYITGWLAVKSVDFKIIN